MASVGKSFISSSKDEKDFIKNVYDYILGWKISGLSVITCDTTIEDQFDNVEVETPTFNFTLTPNIVLQMKRSAEKFTSVNSYVFKVLINDEQKATATVPFSLSSYAIASENERKFFIGHAFDSSLIYIWVGSYDSETVKSIRDASIVICSISDSEKVPSRYGAGYAGADLENATYYKSGVTGVEYSLANLFNYASEPGYIEYITHLSFINAGQEQFRTEEIVNCSEISQGRSVAIQPGNYFSVGSHTLIKLD